ncbi:large ribosomal subunit protein bL9m isoform X2 [Chamaea fasciata]|uniref:large ribosomal subunit protein bL9m isoform X2 n=1 Tax=Chamaea fasciata TaxID=190680 RepID=UPI00336AE3A0
MLAPGAAGRVLSRALSLSHGLASAVVQRVWAVPLGRAGAAPRLHPRRHRVFRLLRDGKHAPRGDMELLLTRAVQALSQPCRVRARGAREFCLPAHAREFCLPSRSQEFCLPTHFWEFCLPSPFLAMQDLGARGDVVSVSKRVGWNKLLPQGLAVYPSPGNVREFRRESRLAQQGQGKLEEPQTQSGQKTLEFLRRCRLEVGMKNNVPWELSPDIVARHFLKNLGVFVPPHALRLPPEPITRWGRFWCDVTVNGLDTVRVPMDVVQFLHPKTKRFRHWREQQRRQLESSRERLL